MFLYVSWPIRTYASPKREFELFVSERGYNKQGVEELRNRTLSFDKGTRDRTGQTKLVWKRPTDGAARQGPSKKQKTPPQLTAQRKEDGKQNKNRFGAKK